MMTTLADKIEALALALLNECAGQEVYGGWKTFDPNQSPCTRALCRAIEQHEQFKREVSDAVEAFFEASGFDATKGLIRFILPKPVDPLVEALRDAFSGSKVGSDSYDQTKDKLRAALAKRGGKIVWENEP